MEKKELVNEIIAKVKELDVLLKEINATSRPILGVDLGGYGYRGCPQRVTIHTSEEGFKELGFEEAWGEKLSYTNGIYHHAKQDGIIDIFWYEALTDAEKEEEEE